ncbi:unnamed protein product, partial [Brassica oleracea]
MSWMGMSQFYAGVYEVVDDPSLDSIISWSKSNKSFVIWDSKELVFRDAFATSCHSLSAIFVESEFAERRFVELISAPSADRSQGQAGLMSLPADQFLYTPNLGWVYGINGPKPVVRWALWRNVKFISNRRGVRVTGRSIDNGCEHRIDHASVDRSTRVENTRVLPTVMCAVAEEESLCYTGRSIDDGCERRIDHDSIDRSAGYDIDSIDRSAGWVIQHAIDRSLERKVGP